MNNILLPTRTTALDQIEIATKNLHGEVTGNYKNMQLMSHFQPIYSLVHKRPVGYEALVRAQNIKGSNIPPLSLFEMVNSEEDAVFLDRLCRNLHLRNFLAKSDGSSWIFINVNPQVTVRGRRYGSYFFHLLERYKIPPHRIVIEILESSIEDKSLLAEAVAYYKDLGCLVAIDDFGAGHSNFDRIWSLNPQIVKLDRSMIVQAAYNPNARRMLPNLTSLLHESGSLVLMEGIETQDEALIAMDSGIDFVQGYYFGKPECSPFHKGNTELLPDLCLKFKDFTQQSTEKYHQQLQIYTTAFRQSAKLIENGIEAEQACHELLNKPQTERCYLLNEEGRQQGSNITSPFSNRPTDPRFKPLSDASDATWSRRPYFQRAMGNPEEIQISRPYLSITGANMCVTLSVMINLGPDIQVFCCDLDWDEHFQK
jgi:EAL domain-containing protein (putative c-di-GMP-specific phosphodiesterase class I)